MRISSTIATSLPTAPVANQIVSDPTVASAVAVTPIVATLETPSRPLLANMVADFGNSGVPTRINGGMDTFEYIDQTKLKGHLPSDVILYLINSDSTTYNHENTALVPALTTVFKAGQSKPTMESITGGRLDQADFNNFVSKMPKKFKDTDRLAIQAGTLDTDTRSQTVRVENIREVMRDILETTDIEGTVLAKPWEQESDFSIQDRIEEFTAMTAEKKSLAEQYQEAKEKKDKARAHSDVSSRPGKPKPVDDRSPALEMLDSTEQALIRDLELRDQEVRAHELAHKAAGAGLTSAATFTYQQGPDGRQYAIGGEVQIQVSPGSTPEDTLRRANQIRAAATAPTDPSPADLRAAGMANRLEQEARAEIAVDDMENAEQAFERAQQDRQSIEDKQSDPMNISRLPEEEMTQMAAMELLSQQREDKGSDGLDSPTELDLQRESERLTVAAPMGAYAQQFKMEQELDRRSFASLELSQELGGIPTPQVVESRELQAERFEERAERNTERRSETATPSPRVDIQPSGSPDVEDARFSLTQDVQQAKEDQQEEFFTGQVDFVTQKEALSQSPQLQGFNGLNSLSSDSVNAIARSSEGLASEVSDLDPTVPQGLSTEDAGTLLQESMKENKVRFESLLKTQFDVRQESRTDLISTDVSLQGNQQSIEIETISQDTLFQPDRSQLDFSEQTITDAPTIAQSSLDTTGPSRLTPVSDDDSRLQLTSQQEQSLETTQAVKALESMFAM